MSSLLFVCVAVAYLVSEIGAASKNPTTPSPDFCQLPGYDVSELKSQDYWVANVTDQPRACVDFAEHGSCTFYFAFCHELHLPENVSAANCDGSAVCQIGYTNATQTSYSLGMYTDDLQFYQSEGGFSMNISDGSNTTGCTAGISTTVTLKCDESAVWMSTNRNLTDFIDVVWNSGSPNLGCPNFEISLQYSGACSNSSNHSVSPTMSSSAMPTPTSTKSHTTSMNVSSTRHPNSSMTTHMSMNMSTHSMHPTISHSAGNHSATNHPGTTTMTSLASPTTASLTATIHTQSSSMNPSTPPPGPQPTTHPNTPSTKPATKPVTKPTENPLSHKVAGLTAGVVIFALIAFILVVALVGVVYYFYKRGANKYSTLSSNITDD